jgi:hypothetical protein
VKLSQFDLDAFRSEVKTPISNTHIIFPPTDPKFQVELVGANSHETFHLDVNHGGAIFEKWTFQNRVKKSIQLVRLDWIGKPHTNPLVSDPPSLFARWNGTEIPCPHIHLYLAEYEDRWVLPASELLAGYSDTTQKDEILRLFIEYCQIKDLSIATQPSLF